MIVHRFKGIFITLICSQEPTERKNARLLNQIEIFNQKKSVDLLLFRKKCGRQSSNHEVKAICESVERARWWMLWYAFDYLDSSRENWLKWNFLSGNIINESAKIFFKNLIVVWFSCMESFILWIFSIYMFLAAIWLGFGNSVMIVVLFSVARCFTKKNPKHQRCNVK